MEIVDRSRIMELKIKIDSLTERLRQRLRDKIQILTGPTIVLSIVMTGTLLWKVQQDNVESLQEKIEYIHKEIVQTSPTKAGLKLEEKLKLEKDILVIEKDKITIQNSVYTTLVQALGGVILSVTAYVGYCNLKIGEKNLKVTEDKQVTERFSKAIEHLGSDKIDIRLGGIYALEQIAIDSPKYHWTIVEILSAFIREKRPLDSIDRVGIDTQAALVILARRKLEQDPKDKYIDLRKIHLAGIDIQKVNFSGFNLRGANLHGANLRGANFSYANFRGANLREANFSGANLFDTNFFDADLTGADLSSADITDANFLSANLNNTILGGNIPRVDFSVTKDAQHCFLDR